MPKAKVKERRKRAREFKQLSRRQNIGRPTAKTSAGVAKPNARITK